MPFPYDAIKNDIDFLIRFTIPGNSYKEVQHELQRRLLFFTMEDPEQKTLLSNGPVDRASRWEVGSPFVHGYQRVLENGGVWIRPIKKGGYYLPQSLWEIMVGGRPKILREDGNGFVQGSTIIAKKKGSIYGAIINGGRFECTFESCVFSYSTFENCTFEACEFHNVDFSKSTFINCTWDSVSFLGPKTDFSGTVWENNTVNKDTIEVAADIPRAGASGYGPWLFDPAQESTWKV